MPRKKRSGGAKPGRKSAPRKPRKTIQEQFGGIPKGYKEVEKLLIAREVVIRGYWDRYPKSEQRDLPDKFKHVRPRDRRGPTAFDVLANDYLSFTPRQRQSCGCG
jgi:hypothetical protein